ncbi:hypothetical protein TTHERM_00059170 (macronuclear) [Tetrahymena thermophila SB210]|uniref:Uncharacterized protein n=1 Tax=Tetrahymena thermophila (strain SB210) TaxID=312017 RepID=I7MDE0_TETTS|nr:hypothetical protein TTHERM_00059170 [Tetrahymena thermophila SB210]EAR87404.1 hypothetical protein TTHERM_00059170 [Tetrahymena thermophila SB210]|eukprot:XP_001007649.1 hypothetical protein TTHERM_00059170 [Tetrahymena thermophila SB210]
MFLNLESQKDSQKIILRDHFQTEAADQRRQLNFNAQFKQNKQRKIVQRKQKSCDKENNQKQIDLDFMKVNSLALAKKGSFKVSYLEDFTINFDKNNKSSIQQQKTQTINNQNKLSPLPKMHYLKNIIINTSPSQRSSQNDIFYKMKTEGSYKYTDLSQGSKEAINSLFNQQTMQINPPTSPSSTTQWNSFNQSINNANSNINFSNLPSCKNTSPCNSKIIELNIDMEKQELLPQITRKKGRSLPPIKLKQNTQGVIEPINPSNDSFNNTQIQILPFRLNSIKKYSYLFDSYNYVQDKIINNQENTLLLEQDSEFSNVQMIFNQKSSKSNKYENLEQSEDTISIQKLMIKSPAIKKQNPFTKKKQSLNVSKHKEQINLQQKYSDIQCVPFKSYKFPSQKINVQK